MTLKKDLKVVLTWNLKKDIDAAKSLIKQNKKEVLKNWYGKENYESLLQEGSCEAAENWINDSFIDSMDDIIKLLQTITDETQNNPLVQRRLKAVGFVPTNNPE